jgi:hypothetical protein
MEGPAKTPVYRIEVVSFFLLDSVALALCQECLASKLDLLDRPGHVGDRF